VSIYLIAEGGLNHNGHLDWALKLCGQAKEAGCDAIKFQKREVEVSTPKEMWNTPREWEGEVIPYIDYRRKVEFGKHEFDVIALHCERINIGFSLSVWDEPSVDFAQQYVLPWVKIPSAHLTNHSLIRKAAGMGGFPIVLSTGMSTQEEIDQAVPLVPSLTGASLMHCTSTYPARDESLNLSYMSKLSSHGFPVGFSSHSPTPYPAIGAGYLGAKSVEAHLTLDRSLPGSDQAASLEFKGMALLRRELDRIDLVMGDGVKRVTDDELPIRRKLRGY
jgi:N-acetylneuraminate synthase